MFEQDKELSALDRIQIKETESGFMTYTFANEEGVIITQAAIPIAKWKTLQAQLISSYERHESDSTLIDFMTVLFDLADST